MSSYRRPSDESNKYLIIVPLVLLIIGIILTYLHPVLSTGFIGIVLSLAGVLSCFVFGMLFADLWSTSRRASQLSKEREERERPDESEEVFYDPFENPEDLEEDEE
jgi:hypothetical protein